uniref:GPI anchored protein n=1 Tax=Moniliophthora roreri TaxID=221103 RepID=A0A0W0FDX8_MONRR
MSFKIFTVLLLWMAIVHAKSMSDGTDSDARELAMLDRTWSMPTGPGEGSLRNLTARQSCSSGFPCGSWCCRNGDACCTTGCCPPGEKCAWTSSGEVGCCPQEYIQCASGDCCPSGTTCCRDTKCCVIGFGGGGGGSGPGTMTDTPNRPPPVTTSPGDTTSSPLRPPVTIGSDDTTPALLNTDTSTTSPRRTNTGLSSTPTPASAGSTSNSGKSISPRPPFVVVSIILLLAIL